MTAIHLPELIRDLAIILGAAAGVSIICQKIKQPVVLGYMLVGFFLGPTSPFFAKITSQPSIQVWADIGVIFLMFSLGLEFSFKDLRKTGGVSTIIAFIELPLMMFTGFLLGLSLGWSNINSLFLGGIISVSSTSIILRSVESLQLKNRSFVQVVFGVLVFEDLLAILLLVILSTLAVTREFAGWDLMWASMRLAIFLVVWFLAGILILPGFVRRAKAIWNDETILIFAIGLCLLMVLLAVQSGFSPALGAFMMGSILAETEQSHHIQRILAPLKNLFSAIFFVSIGMLFEPNSILNQPGVFGCILAATVLGKLIYPTLGGIIAGQSLKTSLQTAMSLAQIGEFSFVIAALGIKLKVMEPSLLGIAVSVSVITTFLTPFLIKHSGWISDYLESLLPRRFKINLETYQLKIQSQQSSVSFAAAINAHLPLMLVNTIFIFACVIFCKTVLGPYLASRELRFAICLLLSIPFFWGLVFARPGRLQLEKSVVKAIRILRSMLASVLFLLLVFQFLQKQSLWIAIGISILMTPIFAKLGSRIYLWLESRVKGELLTKDDSEETPLLPWDSHLSVAEVSPHSPVCGSTIEAVGFKDTFGVLVTGVERGGVRRLAPDAQTVIFPFDRLFLVGSDEALERVFRLLETNDGDESLNHQPDLELFSFTVEPKDKIVGKSLKDSGLREACGLLVGIERKSKRILNPPPDFVFMVRDRLWVVGDSRQLNQVKGS